MPTLVPVAAISVVAELEEVEVESGKRADRPQFAAALSACRLRCASPVIAKLDRLSRDVAFTANLMEGGVEFVACDMPDANWLTLHLLAAVAERVRRIGQRCRVASLRGAAEVIELASLGVYRRCGARGDLACCVGSGCIDGLRKPQRAQARPFHDVKSAASEWSSTSENQQKRVK